MRKQAFPMADPQSDARTRTGVIHVRSRLPADSTVIANELARRRGSAVTVAAQVRSRPGEPAAADETEW